MKDKLILSVAVVFTQLCPIALTISAADTATNVATHEDEPKLFKSEHYPPVTKDEKAMWDWWNRMNKGVPNFQWKRPISLFGKLVDQNGEPVPDAKIDFEWTTISLSGTESRNVISNSSGNFSLDGVHGKFLTVNVNKRGYLSWPKQSSQGFEFANFSDPRFYVPDAGNPVIFKLWKISPKAEPLIWHYDEYNIQNNKAKYLSLKSGEMTYSDSPTGDLGITISDAKPNAEAKFDYTITVFAPNWGGVVESSEDFMVHSPASGYQSSFTMSQAANAPIFNRGFEKKFYLRTADNKYAAVDLVVGTMNDGTGGFANIGYYYNPSGSTNLEYDPAKQIKK